MNIHLLIGLLVLFSPLTWASTPVNGIADLHVHLAAHIPYGIALKGGTPADEPPSEISYNHAFHQQMYLPWLKQSGIKLFVNAALASFFSPTREMAIAEILKQFDFTEKLLAKHPEDFALAKNPAEARKAIEEGKIVFVHALEGADGLIETEADGKFWADKGVAMIGPIHLIDIPYGPASILEGTKSMLNWKGFFKNIFGFERDGLSIEGKKAIGILISSGIIIDTAHMSSSSLKDTLELTKYLPVVMSHGSLKAVRDNDRGLSDNEVATIYDRGGLIGLTAAQDLLNPTSQQPDDYCKGSLDDFALHAKHFYSSNPGRPLALGSDFNGFVNHLRSDCTKNTLEFEQKGLTHPGVLPTMWNALEKRGPVAPFYQSAEAFIQIWEKVKGP